MMKRVRQSPTDPEFVQSPYEFYDYVSKYGDLVYWEDYNNIFAVSYKAVNLFLRDRRWGREVPVNLNQNHSKHLEQFLKVEQNSLLELEPPDHTRIRRLVSRAFTSRSIVSLRQFISNTTHTLLNDTNGEIFELKQYFAEKLPALTIAHYLGVSTDMAEQLVSWSHDMVAMYQAKRDYNVELKASASAEAFADFISIEIDRIGKDDKDCLIYRLLAIEDEGEKLTRDELISTCILLLNAGHEATANSIVNGVKILLESEYDSQMLINEQNLSNTVEEIIRFDPPLHIFERYATCDMELFGYDFKEGDKINLLLAAANRDPTIFNNPNSFDPWRKLVANTSFGAGIHFCLGAPLARMELEIAFSTLFTRFPNMSLFEQPRFADQYHFHGLETLKVNLNNTCK